jgi:hypothetical protein
MGHNKPHTESAKLKISNSKKGSKGYWLGKKMSDEHKANLSKSHKGKTGIKSSNWKGGITPQNKIIRDSLDYKQWRSDCFVRDNWTCRTCRINGVYLTVHHKKGFAKILKEYNIKDILDARKCSELWDITNGITLCEDCHCLTDNYKGKGKRRE